MFTNLAIQSKGSPSHIGISGISIHWLKGKFNLPENPIFFHGEIYGFL